MCVCVCVYVCVRVCVCVSVCVCACIGFRIRVALSSCILVCMTGVCVYAALYCTVPNGFHPVDIVAATPSASNPYGSAYGSNAGAYGGAASAYGSTRSSPPPSSSLTSAIKVEDDEDAGNEAGVSIDDIHAAIARSLKQMKESCAKKERELTSVDQQLVDARKRIQAIVLEIDDANEQVCVW